MYKRILILLLATVLAGCGGQGGSKSADAAADKRREYKIPVPPAMVTDPDQRAEYLAVHYWDDFDFSDTTDLSRPEFLEQLFVDYLDILFRVDMWIAQQSVTAMTGKMLTDSVVRVHFMDVYEKYLHDPNSPMRNEELYIPYLQAVIASPAVDPVEKIRPEYELGMALKNRVGTPAHDFTYTVASGRTSTLYHTRAEYVLLFFNNPGCTACKQYIDEVQATPLLKNMIDSGALKVLAVYTDEDLKEWREYLPQMPTNWINAYDATRQLRKEESYDLKAIPSLYLLDKNKKVLIKDALSVGMITQYLLNQ